MKSQNNSNNTELNVKDALYIFLKSIVITFSISLFISLISYYAFNINEKQVIALFLITFCVQFLVWGLFKTYLQYHERIAIKELEEKQMKHFLSQSKKVKCPSCGHEQYVPVFVELEENRFNCSKCGERSIITVDINVAKIC
jgi:ribosomal protein S27E